jgi:TonB-dependent starch-binding outer membrane protein SusC
MQKLLLSLSLCTLISNVWAQSSVVSGIVYDESKNPLPGVNILLKGSSRGTITNVDGKYSMEAPTDGTLIFSFIGFVNQEEPIEARTIINPIMREDLTELDAVTIVDIGYGTQAAKDLTTAISSVRATDLEKTPVPSLDQALQGRMAGVQVFKNTGAPGGAVTVRVRGTASVNANQEPLYIIDGVPINNTFSGTGGRTGNEVINGLAGINNDDIENIEVLKDAGAASIYGARAANGVVIITTKRGKIGQPTLDVSIYSGVQQMNRRYDLLNASQYAAAVNEGLIRLGGATNFITETPYDTDWQDAIFQLAPMFNGTVQASGGNDKVRYFVSGSYFKQDGIIINSGFDRLSYRTNLDYKVSEKVKFGTNLMFSASNNIRLRNNGGANVQDAFNGNSVFGPSILSSALVMSPMIPIFAPDGTGYASDSLTAIQNPVALATNGEIKSQGIRVIGNTYLEYEVIKGLKFRTNIGIDIRDENETYYQLPGPASPGGASLTKRSFRERIWTSDTYLKYDLDTKSSVHSLSILAGFGTQASVNEGYWVGVADLASQNILELTGGTRILLPYSDADNTWAMLSGYSRLLYDYKKKYYLNLTMRVDGSSRFGPEKKFGFFPAISGAWRISEEPFFDGDFINDLKIRASYGVTGNDQIPPFGWRASADVLSIRYLGQSGAVPISILNEGYSWESSAQSNIGVDLSLLNSRITFTTDVYLKQTSGLLLGVRLPRTTGFENAIKNIGDIENKGLELGINFKVLQKSKLTWTINSNISFNRNKVTRLVDGNDQTGGSYGYSHVARVGLPIGSIQLYQLEDTVDPETGRRRIKDLNNNGVRDAGDLVIVGNAYPKHTGGFTNNFNYGQFDASVFFSWSMGNDIINETRSFTQDVGKSTINAVGTNLSAEALGRWTKPGDNTSFPGIDYSNSDIVSPGSLAAGGVPTDQNLEDGSYLRLKALQIGYNVPREKTNKFNLSSARIYLTANNLLTFTKYSGYDPEVSHLAGANIAVGIDSGTYPQPRTLIVGINIGF